MHNAKREDVLQFQRGQRNLNRGIQKKENSQTPLKHFFKAGDQHVKSEATSGSRSQQFTKTAWSKTISWPFFLPISNIDQLR